MKLHIDGEQKCETCSRMFPNKKALRNHRIIHREHKYFCEICGRGFHRPHVLRVNFPLNILLYWLKGFLEDLP